jgi:Na+(H+)/acetate symporter ActP
VVINRCQGSGAGRQAARRRGHQHDPEELGQRFLEPGLFLKNPIDQISLGMALVLGTAGMPHILMRFFTVPTAQAARKSVIWAMGIIGGFYVLTLFLGMGAAINVGRRHHRRRRQGRQHGGSRCWPSSSVAARIRCWATCSWPSSRPWPSPPSSRW